MYFPLLLRRATHCLAPCWRLALAFVLCLGSALAQAGPTVLVMGDSLSAGYGMAASEAWPALLNTRLQSAGGNYSVVNLSLSGETTAGGLSRLPAALSAHKPSVVVLALGANDGLRGLPLKAMVQNLEQMVTLSQSAGARVLLVGMRLPPNYGDYAEAFGTEFDRLARRRKLAYLPFLLAPIAAERSNFQTDGLHPTAAAQGEILAHVWRVLQAVLEKGGKHQ